jgi:Protein of unknown function (DUF1822)
MKDLQIPQPFFLPLTATAHKWVKDFSTKQGTTTIEHQSYLNALSVWAMNEYLHQLKIDTDLKYALTNESADLLVSGVGFIECLPLWKTHRDVMELDIKHLMDRDYIAYVIIELSDNLDMATMLGYIPANDTHLEILDLSKLKSIYSFPNYVEKIQQSTELLQNRLIHLGIFEDPIFYEFFAELGTQLAEQYIPQFWFFTESLRIYRESDNIQDKQLGFEKILQGETEELCNRNLEIYEIQIVRLDRESISTSKKRTTMLAKQWIDILDKLNL